MLPKRKHLTLIHVRLVNDTAPDSEYSVQRDGDLAGKHFGGEHAWTHAIRYAYYLAIESVKYLPEMYARVLDYTEMYPEETEPEVSAEIRGTDFDGS